mmetsp:Transcript_42523/g.113486  ORF Transcript_42523/g.113486 Transcript_42523/m.113486 type:complete len:100 (+) Transcript_42523:1746-2045(+)
MVSGAYWFWLCPRSFSPDGFIFSRRLIEGCETCVMMVEGCALRLCYVVCMMMCVPSSVTGKLLRLLLLILKPLMVVMLHRFEHFDRQFAHDHWHRHTRH